MRLTMSEEQERQNRDALEFAPDAVATDRLRETMAELDATRAALAEERAKVKTLREALEACKSAMFDGWDLLSIWPDHDDDCPEDDTCECVEPQRWSKALNAAVAAIAATVDGKEERERWKWNACSRSRRTPPRLS